MRSLDELIAEYHRPLKGYIAARISGSLDDAENIVQEIWMELLKVKEGVSGFQDYDPEKSSFFTYMINRYAQFHIRRFHTARSRVREKLVYMEVPEQFRVAALENFSDTPDTVMELKEEIQLMDRAYRTLFAITWLCGGYPHQQLAFGIAKHILGTGSKRRIEGKYAELESQFATTELDDLAGEYWKKYCECSGLNPCELTDIQPLLDPMVKRLDITVSELLKYGQQLMSQMGDQGDIRTGNTVLTDYTADRKFGVSVSDWCDKLEKRIRSVISTSSSKLPCPDLAVHSNLAIPVPGESQCCSRCKMRHLLPCRPGLTRGNTNTRAYNSREAT